MKFCEHCMVELGRYRYLESLSIFSSVFFHVGSVFGIGISKYLGISDVNLLISDHLGISALQSPYITLVQYGIGFLVFLY